MVLPPSSPYQRLVHTNYSLHKVELHLHGEWHPGILYQHTQTLRNSLLSVKPYHPWLPDNQSLHWFKPELLEQPDLLQVRLTLHVQNEPVNEPINKRQQAIISTMKQNPSMTRENLANSAHSYSFRVCKD
mgnify:CR=1 FL=1